MSLRRRLSSAIDGAVRRRLYGGPIGRAARATGIEDRLADAYWGLQLALTDEVQTLAVGPAEADFALTTRAEYRRQFQNLEGERALLDAFLADLAPTDVVWDVGASVGLYACLAADVLDDGAVICFEPNPHNLASLRENVALNGAEGTVTVREEALADEAGTAELALKAREAGESGTLVERDWMAHGVEVELARGDDLVAAGAVPAPDAVKIDVEGAELAVVRGMADALARDDCRLVHCEVHPGFLPDYGGSVEAVEAALTEAGFAVERRGGCLRGTR